MLHRVDISGVDSAISLFMKSVVLSYNINTVIRPKLDCNYVMARTGVPKRVARCVEYVYYHVANVTLICLIALIIYY